MRWSYWRYYALATVFLWASAYVFTKVALQHFSAISLDFLRCAVASAALMPVLILKRQTRLPLRSIPELAVSGAAGFGLYLILY